MGRATDSAPGSSPRVLQFLIRRMGWWAHHELLSHGLPREVSPIFPRTRRAMNLLP